jgi:hypothetical protein
MNEHKNQPSTIEIQKDEAPSVSRNQSESLWKVQVWLGGNDWGNYRTGMNVADAALVARVASETYHLRTRVVQENE